MPRARRRRLSCTSPQLYCCQPLNYQHYGNRAFCRVGKGEGKSSFVVPESRRMELNARLAFWLMVSTEAQEIGFHFLLATDLLGGSTRHILKLISECVWPTCLSLPHLFRQDAALSRGCLSLCFYQALSLVLLSASLKQQLQKTQILYW